jgi:hypothetical protein
MRLAAALAIVALSTALPAGCGGSSPSDEGSTSGGSTRGETAPPPNGGAPAGAIAKSCEAHSEDAGALRATGIPCDQARQVMYGWQRERSCPPAGGASRSSCLTRSYRCQSARTDRGLAVSCSRSGESVAFIAKRG